MAFEFRPAARENVSLLIGLSGASGSGKTYTGLRLARGIAGEAGRIALIDTEAGRAKHYADQFTFDHGDLVAPFTPARYAQAIAAADAAGYAVIIVDSASHEWAGERGVLEMQEAELDRMAGSDFKKREACKMASWIKPKHEHKKLIYRLLQIRAHVLLLHRAEPKIEMVRGADGKVEVREKQSLTGLHGWIPICEKNLPFELTLSVQLMPDRPGVPIPIKLQEQHRAFLPLDQPITEATGAALAAWAKGVPAAPLDDEQDWLRQLLAAKTLGELRTVGAALKAASEHLPPKVITALRAAYDARLEKLGARRKRQVAAS
jgi:AAA domain